MFDVLMKYLSQKIENVYLIRLFRGEDIIESIQKFCENNSNIGAGMIKGIGAVSVAKLGFFDGEKYKENIFSENLELVSLLGNIAQNQIIHIHGIFGRADGSCVGGHIFPGCTVSVTCEIQIIVLKPSVSRKEDPQTKLNLLDLPIEIT
ncbi:MAG: PPC domain-containing DNA-binding protein [Candidatus Hodarchaeota archaeon]